MTERDRLDRLYSELARAHDQALGRSEQQIEQSRRSFLARLERAASFEPARVQLRTARRGLTFLLAAAVLGAVAAIGVRMGRPPLRVEISSEASMNELPVGAPSHAPAADDPCAHPLRSPGTQPLIDDFEDGDSMMRPLEGRNGAWTLFKDNDPPGLLRVLTPAPRSRPTARSRKALHATGGELRDWGASIQLDFKPSCYDASAYGGIAFSAKGPGRIYLGVREMRVVPVKWGGTCPQGCYDAHQKKVDLGPDWHRYEVAWGELRQRGYRAPPLDPARIHDLAFLVQPSDTPFDLWIDDVSFILRRPSAPTPQPESKTP